jgi:uncharacterized protein YoxC
MTKGKLRLAVLEVVALVAVLAGYLIAIADALQRVSRTLARVTAGVRAIERQTEPLGPVLSDIDADLSGVIAALEGSAQPESSAPSGA